MLKLRLEGTPTEIALAVDRLRQTFIVYDESPDYPNRPPSLLARRYMTVGLLGVDAAKVDHEGEHSRRWPLGSTDGGDYDRERRFK